MITPGHAHLMARYNQWQNRSLYAAAHTLDTSALTLDRGAYFGSILATLSHILWGDQIWWARFQGLPRPDLSMQDALTRFATLEALEPARIDMDQTILSWASGPSLEDLPGDLSWYSGAAGADMTLPLWLCITHAYNHQTHHRGQVHAMLTAAGGQPEDTDIFLMPGLAI